MKRFLLYIVVSLIASIAISCAKESDSNPDWAVIDAFDDFLFKKYEPELMSRTLVLERNQDAVKSITTPITIRLIRDVEDKAIPVGISDVQVFIKFHDQEDFIPVPNNEFDVPCNIDSVRVGIKLNKSLTAKSSHTYNFRLAIDNPGYEMINDLPFKNGMNELDDYDTNLKIVVNHRANVLKVIVIWTFITLLGLLVLWFLILKPIIFRRFRFDELKIIYLENGTRKGAPQDITISHARKLVLSKYPGRQSGFNRLWTGRILYLENDYWENDVEIIPCGTDGLSFNETISDTPLFRTKSSMIESTNGPRRPFVVTKRNSSIVANISIS